MRWHDTTYERSTDSHQTEFGADGASVCEAVLSCVAAANNRSPSDLPVLYHTIDPDVLSSVFCPQRAESQTYDVAVTFEYANTRVLVSGHPGYGIVQVIPSTQGGE